MSKRLEILKASLVKKQELFDSKLQDHFDTVKMANGQPLNDKRNGRATLSKWDRQNEALRGLDKGIESTKEAIEREKSKIAYCESVSIPKYLQDALDAGEITQWRKFPRFFFVVGVDKGRIVLDEKTGLLAHRFLKDVPKEQYPLFRDVYNKLNKLSKS